MCMNCALFWSAATAPRRGDRLGWHDADEDQTGDPLDRAGVGDESVNDDRGAEQEAPDPEPADQPVRGHSGGGGRLA